MKIYISYSWKQPAKSIVKNWLCPCLKQSNIDYYIDEKDCYSQKNINNEEQSINLTRSSDLVEKANELFNIEKIEIKGE